MPTPGDLVVDADGHVCEPPDLWLRLRWNADPGARRTLFGTRALALYGITPVTGGGR